MNKKAIFAFAVLLIVILLVGAVVVDAKSKGGGGSRSSGSKSFSSALSSSSAKDTAVKAVGVSGLTALGKSTKKKVHHDDDLFENETEDDMAEQASNTGVLPAFLAVGMLFMARRCRGS